MQVHSDTTDRMMIKMSHIRSSSVYVLFSLLFSLSICRYSFAGAIPTGAVTLSGDPGDEVSVIINLADQAEISSITEKNKSDRRALIVDKLRGKADETQGPLKAFLRSKGARRIAPFWITNAIAATIPSSMLSELANLPEVRSIEADTPIYAPPVTPAAAAGTSAAYEWNISAINAPALWNMGINGAGVVVANVDTGVDPDHADLKGKWRGGEYSWYSVFSDPLNASLCASPDNCTACELSTTPCDMDGHGTGTMGLMVGGDAGGTAIGVAPGSKWIAVKIFNDDPASPGALSSLILDAYQWLISLPAGSVPDVINNSFGGTPNICADYLQSAINTLKTAGTEVVFSAGNDGPGASTSSSPANNPAAFGVGSVFTTDTLNPAPDTIFVSNFSSRGPSACDGGIFPRIVAPGENIKIATLTNGGLFPASYVAASGTSFSAPHVAGAAALILSAFPDLKPAQLEEALEQTANRLGMSLPDNSYGYGLLDVNAAYNSIVNTMPEISVSPMSIDFGSVNTGSSAEQTITITSQGGAALTIGGIRLGGANPGRFAIRSDRCSGITVSPSGSCTLRIDFKPLSIGPKTATLSIESDDPRNNVVTVSLKGLGTDTLPPKGSLTINGGAKYAGKRAITLSLTASDNGGGPIQMCISSTTACSSWTAFSSPVKWTLPAGDGTKTIYASFKDRFGNANLTPFSDSIVLDTTRPTNGSLTAFPVRGQITIFARLVDLMPFPGNGQINLKWAGFSDSLSGIARYKLAYGTAGFPANCSTGVIYRGTGNSFSHSGLSAGTTYYYRLCAVDRAGNVSTGATARAVAGQ